MEGFVTALGVVAIAEVGDKTMLASVAFAARLRAGAVLAGIALGAAAVMGASVAVGHVLRASLPGGVLTVAAGSLFLAFALWTLLGRDGRGDDVALDEDGNHVLTVAAAFGVAELGDKTMLAAIGLAAHQGAVATWLGAVAALVAVNAAAVAVGHQLGERLPRRLVRAGTAVVFAAVGGFLLVEGLAG